MNIEQQEHPVLTIAIFLGTGLVTGIASEQDLDLILSRTLKITSILSFVVGTIYALWKWRADYNNAKIVNTVMHDYQEKKEQKAKRKPKK